MATPYPLRNVSEVVRMVNGRLFNNPGSARENGRHPEDPLVVGRSRNGLLATEPWRRSWNMNAACRWKGAACERETHYESRGLCSKHYSPTRRRGILEEYPKPVLPAICKVEGCTRPRVTKGYCHSHYIRLEYHGLSGPLGPPSTA